MDWEWQEQLGCGHPAWWKRLVPMVIPGGKPWVLCTGEAFGVVGHRHARDAHVPRGARPRSRWHPHPSSQLYHGGSRHSRCSGWTDLRCSWGISVGDLCLRMCLFLPFHTFRGNSIFLNASIPLACCCQPYEAWSFLHRGTTSPSSPASLL